MHENDVKRIKELTEYINRPLLIIKLRREIGYGQPK